MKTKGFTVATAVIIVAAVLCAGICGWQTAYLVSQQDIFAAEHPDYISHSWCLLALVLAPALLAWGQAALIGRPVLCGSVSVVMTVLEILALRAAADQHYHMGMLTSDYGLQVPFESGWVLMILVVALIVATIAQLLIVVFSALTRSRGK